MNRRLMGVFAFALVVASITSFAVYRLIILQMKTPVRTVAPVSLLVADHDLQLGALIHDGDLKAVPWSAPIPEHAIKTKQDVVGRGVVANIFHDEPILDERLAPKGAGAGLASTIPVGMRAVALRVNEVVGLAGFVLPGMRVDVLVAGTVPGMEINQTLCRTVLQDIEVLSAGQKIEKNVEGKPESAQVVNLLVTPDQAEILDLASDQARVQLVLRNPIDTKEQVTHGSSLASLFGVSLRAAAPPPQMFAQPAPRVAPVAVRQEDAPTVEVFSGVKKSEQRLDIPQGGR